MESGCRSRKRLSGNSSPATGKAARARRQGSALVRAVLCFQAQLLRIGQVFLHDFAELAKFVARCTWPARMVMLYWTHLENRSEEIMPVRIRTITVGVGEPHPLSDAALDRALKLLRGAETLFREAGVEVQTTRLATRPLFTDRLHARDAEIVTYAHALQERCDRRQITYLSLGPVLVDDPAQALDRLKLLPEILSPNAALNASVQLATTAHGVRTDAAVPTAKVVQALAQQTPGGIGNMRFAMVANAPPRGPFFPTAYQPDSLWGFSIGLQSAGLVMESLAEAVRDSHPGPAALGALESRLITSLEREGRVISDLAERLATEYRIPFSGLDLSPGTHGDESIADAIESIGMGAFGEPGTVAVIAAITGSLKKTKLKTCGYNGIFLPVLEDAGIVRRLMSSKITIPSLLLYSSVCGAGLDTIPIPGDTPVERIAATMLDVATLSVRYNKPLSARFMPIMGRRAGEMTTFDSPWLVNSPVMSI